MVAAMQEPGTEPAERRAALSLLLASRSPRRRQLLGEHGFEHVAVHPGFEDGVLERGGVTPAQWVQALALLKAHAGAAMPEARGRIVIGADTACLQEGMLIGTPRTSDEARAMIKAFRGREHEVLTGVAVLDLRHCAAADRAFSSPPRFIFTDVARVRMGEIDDATIDAYVREGQWQGKAGAYNLSERIAAGWPITFSGDASTIMGLPMQRLSALLSRLAATTPLSAS